MKETSRVRWADALFVLVWLTALALRIYGIEWDQGLLFHPDERQILVIADRISFPFAPGARQIQIIADRISFPWPPDIQLLLTPDSPWNPGFFAYGSLPIYLLRIVADLAGQFDPDLARLNSIHLVARALSALFDLGTVGLLYLLGKRLHSVWTGLLAALLCTLTVLHIQLSHFYAVDTVLTFFVVLTLYTALALIDDGPRLRLAWGIGLAMGMALATKVSAAPLALPICIAWWISVKVARRNPDYPLGHTMTRWWRFLAGSVFSGIIALLTFVVLQPYAVIDVARFVVDVLTEGYMAQGLADIPYTRQFIGTWAYLYPLWQMIVWTLGPLLGLVGWGSVVLGAGVAMAATTRRAWALAGRILVPLAWVAIYFGIVGGFHAKFLRYMLPITPLLCFGAAWLLVSLVRQRRGVRAVGVALTVLVITSTGVYAAAYMHIYSQPHTWVQATRWLCRELPPASRIMVEHWDDPLPLIQGTDDDLRCYGKHYIIEFPAYNPDTQAKVNGLVEMLETCDYVVLSSNRLYNTIPRLAERYPASSRYYELLLGEQLGFELVYYATSYPQLGGVRWVDDTFHDPDLPMPRLLVKDQAQHVNFKPGRADESYSVYDHPMPLVFKKTRPLSYAQLYALLADVAETLPVR